MAMRSQVYAWDLYNSNIPIYGGVITTSFATIFSPIKDFNKYASSTNTYGSGATAVYPEYTLNNEYATTVLDPSLVDIGTLTNATIKAAAVDGVVPPRNIEKGVPDPPAPYFTTIAKRGNGYKVGSIFSAFADNTTANGNLTQFIVNDIFDGGVGYSTGDGVATTTLTGSGTGLTVNIAAVDGTFGEITSYNISSAGTGYEIGDTVSINGGTTNAVIEIDSIDIDSGGRYFNLGVPISLFTGGKGNGLGRLPNTTATQFVVIDSYGCTPSTFTAGSNIVGGWGLASGDLNGQNVRNSIAGPRAYLQIYVNTTGYFKDPDGVPRDGVPGTSIPYPRAIHNSYCKISKQTPIYILPGQVWDIRLTCYNDSFSPISGAGPSGIAGNQTKVVATAPGQLQAFIKYTLYDGADALIATKLMEMGIAITPDAVDNYKQRLIEAKMAADARKALQE